MAQRDTTDTAGNPIDGLYTVEATKPLSMAGASAFAVRDDRGERPDLMAVRIAPTAPPRARVIRVLAESPSPGVLGPLAAGVAPGPDGRQAMFVIGQRPPGPSLAETRRAWSEMDLMTQVLRPAAEALEALRVRGLTHRAIRPDNLFLRTEGAPVVLGPFWAEPPASLQPAVYEPPYVAICPPAGRGDGTIADDIYALGVLLLRLVVGREPLAGRDVVSMLRQKVELGSYAVLVGSLRLPALITDLLRNMLAEDPDHRPPPSVFIDPLRARARRVAARPPRKAQAPIEIGGIAAPDARTLAFAIARDPETGGRLLRSGSIVHWIRRGLGDATIASKIEDLVRQQAAFGEDRSSGDGTLSMQAIVLLDPLAPLCWRGLAFWPDALGALLLAAGTERHTIAALEEVISREATLLWVMIRERGDLPSARHDARQMRAMLKQPGWSGGLPRLRYALNPLQPCASPLLDGVLVSYLSELLAALDACAAAEQGTARPVDPEICALIAARHDEPIDNDILTITHGRDQDASLLAILKLFSELHVRYAPTVRFPRLAAWLARLAAPLVESWRNPGRRAKVAKALAAAAAEGNLPDMLALLDNEAARAADDQQAAAAAEAVRAIDEELARITAQAPQRVAWAQQLGTEFAAVVGTLALAVVFFMMVVL